MAKGEPRAKGRSLSQGEIEEILDEIDQALLAGKVDQLKPLSQRLMPSIGQVPELVTRRLIDGRTGVPAYWFDFLEATTGRQALKHLRRIAEDPAAADIVRFGARRRAGWPQRGAAKRRQAFLATLKDAESTLVAAADQATWSWPADGNILEEVLGYLAVISPERRLAVARRVGETLGGRATWLLRGVLHIPDPPTQRLALDWLVRLRDPGAAGPVARLAKTAKDGQVKSEAAAAAQRLRLRAVGGKPPEPQTLPGIDRALLSAIDSDGGQVVLIVRKHDEHTRMVTNILLDDQCGIMGAMGLSRCVPEQVAGEVDELVNGGVPMVEVDLAAARWVLEQSVEINGATGHALPPEYEVWELLAHDSYPPAEDEPTVVAELDDTPYRRRADLVKASGQLVDHPFFRIWTLPPEQTAAAMLRTPPPLGPDLGDRQYRRMIQELVDEPMLAGLRQRLRHQAWLLERSGDMAARDMALAVAAQLAEGKASELGKQPFLRGLVNRSLFVGLLGFADLGL